MHRIPLPWLFRWSIIALAFTLSCSKFALTVSQFMAGGFLLFALMDKGYRKEFTKPKVIYFGLAAVFIIHLLWFLPGGDWAYGFRDLKTKIPFLTIPLFFAWAPKGWFPRQRVLFYFVLAGFVASTVFSFLLFTHIIPWESIPWEINNFRDLSPLVSHIRLCTIGVLVFIWGSAIWKQKVVFSLLLLIYVLAVFVMLQSLTGFFILGLGLCLKGLLNKENWIRYSTLAAGILIGAFLTLKWTDYNKISPDYVHQVNSDTTALGNLYLPRSFSHQKQNNYPIWEFVNYPELKAAWLDRTGIDTEQKAGNGNRVLGILVRYLTSKGLRKDNEGVQTLSETDIKNIQLGYPFAGFDQMLSINKRLQSSFFEINVFRDGISPNGHSLMLRIKYMEAGYTIWKANPILGVGTCNTNKAFKEYYAGANTQLKEKYQRKAHNQWLTFLLNFGLIGFCLIMGCFLYTLRNIRSYSFWSVLGLLTLFLTFFWEDTLETQIGVSSFLFFYCCILRYSEPEDTIAL